jgi:hypothetical protein
MPIATMMLLIELATRAVADCSIALNWAKFLPVFIGQLVYRFDVWHFIYSRFPHLKCAFCESRGLSHRS